MKRRIQGLVSSTSGKSTKKRAWQEEGDEADKVGDQPSDLESEEEGDAPPAPPPPLPEPAPPASHSDEDAWDALEIAGGDEPVAKPVAKVVAVNPVVWMEISVAGNPRGRIYLELFRDIAPGTAENFRRLCLGEQGGYKGTEIYKVFPGKLAEGGDFDRAADGKEFDDESFELRHTKGGLLTMANDGPNTNTSRFQVTMRPLPHLDGKQVVFGQVLAETNESGPQLHILHWINAMATTSGTPIEALVIEDCGECDMLKVQQLRGAVPSAGKRESQEARYSRGGIHSGKLEDAISKDSAVEMLELLGAAVDSWEWQAKKAERTSDGAERSRKSTEVEAGLKALRSVLEDVEFKVGDVVGPDGKLGRKAKTLTFRVRDLEEMLAKLY